MKLLYGIQGTGNGHLARARALTPALRKVGIEPDFVFSGRNREDFFNMNVFGDNFRVFNGLSLITHRGELKTFQTLIKNKLGQFVRDVSRLDVKEYDLVISDFEPVSAWAAKLKGIPAIGISHQTAFHYDVPKVQGYASAKLLMKIFAPTRYAIGLHWHHFNQPILPPLIEPQHSRESIKNKILVYMGFESVDDIIELLKPFNDYDFHIYAKVSEKRDYGHIQVHPLSHEAFHKDLEDCSGVISNAGFELASECLHLGKKLLVKPLLGQYEQLCNALALQAMQRATIMNKLDQHMLAKWLEAKPHKPFDYPDVAIAIAEWIQSTHEQNGDWNQQDALLNKLWQSMPVKIDYQPDFGKEILQGIIA